MTNLNEWAARWGVPFEAVEDLRRQMGAVDTENDADAMPRSEAWAQNQIRLEASRKGARLFRNNVGACQDANGNFIRYGLANDSEQMNKVVKSSDLIGFAPRRVEAHHVGQTWAVFVAREVKAPGWKYTATPREVAQGRFIELVLAHGGDACFATGEGTL